MSGPQWPRIRTPDPTLGRTRPGIKPVPVERVPGMPAHLKGGIDPPTKPKRQRVVLDYAAPVTAAAGNLHSRAELAQQTSWGETLIKDLIHALLRSGALLAVLGLLLIGGLPVAMWLLPEFARLELVGVPLAWLLLGVAPFPLLAGVGLLYIRVAERHERDFVDMIEH
ncbi:MAG: hypothetical protein ACRDQB_09285 [Thermocrispum sp.]